MRIILDECVPSIVKRGLPARNIVTVQEMGWSGTKNGQLLAFVQVKFDVFITSDKNIRHQQNLSSLELAFIVLPGNQVPTVEALLSQIDAVLDVIKPKDFIEI